MMLSKDFPLTHDITGKDKKKQGKQVGSQPKGWGSIYVAESENCAVKELSNVNFSRKGEITVVISEANKSRLSFRELQESDKKRINNLINNMSIKDIIKKVSQDREIPKKLIYNYCLSLKNEN